MIGLEAVAVEEQHGEAELRILARGLDRAAELLEEVGAVRQVGEVVVVRDVLQAPFRDPAGGDVLDLEDEAGRIVVGGGEERGVQGDRDDAAIGPRTSKLDRARGGGARKQALELRR